MKQQPTAANTVPSAARVNEKVRIFSWKQGMVKKKYGIENGKLKGHFKVN